MTHGWCTTCEKWGAHTTEECKFMPDPLGRRRYFCEVCDRRYTGKGLKACRTRGCRGHIELSTLHDVGPKKTRRKP